MYHYVESGLDNIFLENGFIPHSTPYGDGMSIQDSAGLHRAIGIWLITMPKPLNGAELRFLRTEMETTQRDLAACLGTTEQTLRLWEKNRKKNMPGSADRLLRVVYKEYTGGDGHVKRMLDRLAELNQLSHARGSFRNTRNKWKDDSSAARNVEECVGT